MLRGDATKYQFDSLWFDSPRSTWDEHDNHYTITIDTVQTGNTNGSLFQHNQFAQSITPGHCHRVTGQIIIQNVYTFVCIYGSSKKSKQNLPCGHCYKICTWQKQELLVLNIQGSDWLYKSLLFNIKGALFRLYLPRNNYSFMSWSVI
jgi:hypothetical protein